MTTYSSHIEPVIVGILQRGPREIVDLIEEVRKSRGSVTKQGVYQSLRKLKAEEKIVLHGRSASLNIQWLRKMSDFFSIAQYFYSPAHGNPDYVLHLREKEKVVFTFKTLVDLDVFASHAIHMFAAIIDAHEPIYAFNPHEIFSYGRSESEAILLKAMEEINKQVLLLATHSSPLDSELKKRFAGTNVQYHIEHNVPFDTGRYYFNVYGQYLLEVYLDSHVSKELETFFKNTGSFTKEAQEELSRIFATKGRHKIVISLNKKKADKYKTFFAKFFVIPKMH